MRIESINALAALCAEGHPNTVIDSTESLAAMLASIVAAPVRGVTFTGPNGEKIEDRKIPCILTAHSGCTIRVEREDVRRAVSFGFPITDDEVDNLLMGLGKYKSPEQEEREKFEEKLFDALDAYGHLTWTVGNEDWLACADAVTGRYKGKLYLATHVVVDCESGGFTDTFDKNIYEVTGDPPKRILSSYLDNCAEHYAGKRGEQYDIDLESCTQAIEGFDAHVAELWSDNPADPVNVTVDWDEEGEEGFDPVAMGWVGSDGRP